MVEETLISDEKREFRLDTYGRRNALDRVTFPCVTSGFDDDDDDEVLYSAYIHIIETCSVRSQK